LLSIVEANERWQVVGSTFGPEAAWEVGLRMLLLMTGGPHHELREGQRLVVVPDGADREDTGGPPAVNDSTDG